MSRIGRMPIAVPAGVTVDIAENNKVTVKGPKGTLERVLPREMEIKLEGAEIVVTRPNDLKKMKSLHGLTRTLINNMILGVTNEFTRVLEVNGVGYRAQKQGKKYLCRKRIPRQYLLCPFQSLARLSNDGTSRCRL